MGFNGSGWGFSTSTSSNEAVAEAVQNTTGLRAIVAELREDKQVRLVEDKSIFYRFDTTGTGVDDDDLVIVPDDVTPPTLGRWFKVEEIITSIDGGNASSF
jgi:hypothetical protein